MFNKINKYVIKKPTKLFVGISAVLIYIVIGILFIVITPYLISQFSFLVLSQLSIDTLSMGSQALFEITLLGYLILFVIVYSGIIYTTCYSFKKVPFISSISENSQNVYINILTWLFILYQIVGIFGFVGNISIGASPNLKLIRDSGIVGCYNSLSKLDFNTIKFNQLTDNTVDRNCINLGTLTGNKIDILNEQNIRFAFILKPVDFKQIDLSQSSVEVLKNGQIISIISFNSKGILKKSVEEDIHSKILSTKVGELYTTSYHGFIKVNDMDFEYLAINN